MKKSFALFLSVVMILSLVACGQKEEPAPAAPEKEPAASTEVKEEAKELEPIEISFATANATANIESNYSERFMELCEEMSDGKITFDYSDGGILGTQTELLEGTLNGVYDLTCTSVDGLASWVPEITVASNPCMIEDYEHGARAYDGEFGQGLKDIVKETIDLEILNFMWCGFRNVCSEKPITKIEDAKGVMIRVPEAQAYMDMTTMMGFSYVPMSWAEAYTSMNSGIIQAVEVPLQNIYEQGFYDLGKNVLMSRHIFNTNSIMANGEFMNSLPQEYRDIIYAAIEQATEEERVECISREEGYMKSLEEVGCTINYWDDASFDQLQEEFGAYWATKAEAINDTAVELLNAAIASK